MSDGTNQNLPPSRTPPQQNSSYLSAAYWDERFAHEDSYEWLRSFEEIQHLLAEHVLPTDRILVVGNGTSALPIHMSSAGFCNITATDLSPAAVSCMQQKEQQASPITWQVADMLALPFADGTFDAIIEKAALDCLLVDCKSPWDVSPEASDRVHSMLKEAHRVLTATGVFLSLTWAQPHFRRPLLLAQGFSWGLTHREFSQDQGLHYHFYALKKGTRTAADVPIQLLSYDPQAHAVAGGLAHEYMDQEDFMSCIDL